MKNEKLILILTFLAISIFGFILFLLPIYFDTNNISLMLMGGFIGVPLFAVGLFGFILFILVDVSMEKKQ